MEAVHEGRTDDAKRVLDEHPESIRFQYPHTTNCIETDTSGLGSTYTCEHKNEIAVM